MIEEKARLRRNHIFITIETLICSVFKMNLVHVVKQRLSFIVENYTLTF